MGPGRNEEKRHTSMPSKRSGGARQQGRGSANEWEHLHCLLCALFMLTVSPLCFVSNLYSYLSFFNFLLYYSILPSPLFVFHLLLHPKLSYIILSYSYPFILFLTSHFTSHNLILFTSILLILFFKFNIIYFNNIHS